MFNLKRGTNTHTNTPFKQKTTSSTSTPYPVVAKNIFFAMECCTQLLPFFAPPENIFLSSNPQPGATPLRIIPDIWRILGFFQWSTGVPSKNLRYKTMRGYLSLNSSPLSRPFSKFSVLFGVNRCIFPRELTWNPKNWWVWKTHLANGPWKKSLNFIFPTKYGIPKSSRG